MIVAWHESCPEWELSGLGVFQNERCPEWELSGVGVVRGESCSG